MLLSLGEPPRPNTSPRRRPVRLGGGVAYSSPMDGPLPPPPLQRAARLVVTIMLAGLGLWILWDFVPALVWAIVFAVATWPLYLRFCRGLNVSRGTLAA